MKLLKLTLGDGKPYTFKTFSVLQVTVMKKEHKKYLKMEDRIDSILFEVDEKGKKKKDVKGNWIVRENKTEADELELEKIQDEIMDFGVDVLRKSLCNYHKEFTRDSDDAKDRIIKDKLLDLIDVNDLRKLITFVFNGSYQHEKTVIEEIVIDLPEAISTNAAEG